MEKFLQWLAQNESIIMVLFAALALGVLLWGLLSVTGSLPGMIQEKSDYIEINGRSCEITLVCVE